MKGLQTRVKGKTRLIGASMSLPELKRWTGKLPAKVPGTHPEAVRQGFRFDASEARETDDGRRGNGLAEFVDGTGHVVFIPFTVVRRFGKPQARRIRRKKR